MQPYKISREGNKLVIEISSATDSFETAEIIDTLSEFVTEYLDEEFYGPIDEESEDLLDFIFDDDEVMHPSAMDA